MCTCCMVNLCNINGFCYELLIKIQQTAYLLFNPNRSLEYVYFVVSFVIH